MDTARIITEASRFWDCHPSWRATVASDWPQWERAFTTIPLVGEYEAAFRRAFDAGLKAPPQWEPLRRSIFAARKAAAAQRQEAALGLTGCRECDGRGFRILPVVETVAGDRVVPTLDNPVAGWWYEWPIPCECSAGAAFAADHGYKLTADRQRAALALSHASMAALAEVRAACGEAVAAPAQSIDDATADAVAGGF